MARAPRFICPGVPHHVTQRGNRRGRVFFSDSDFLTYLAWLHDNSRQFGLDVLAYCLMTNHVHLIIVPESPDSIPRGLQHLQMRYAQRVNRAKSWKGHVWQGRYFSTPLDETYLWAAIRYVELNPVRAHLAARAEDYPWSSARAHCEATRDPLLSVDPTWTRLVEGVGDWSSWLAAGVETSDIEVLRKHTRRGLPCGSRIFTKSLESRAGRPLMSRPRGRPRKDL